MKSPEFSIVIPTFNRPRRLAECLRALTALQYATEDFEVIVVDDGSTEDLRPVIEAVQARIPIQLIVKENAGPASARNRGAACARGEVLVAKAINEYQVKIPMSDLRRYPVLFALKQNGEYMRVRSKGPIWIIYPRETYPELDSDKISDRWVWQLSEIIIQ